MPGDRAPPPAAGALGCDGSLMFRSIQFPALALGRGGRAPRFPTPEPLWSRRRGRDRRGQGWVILPTSVAKVADYRPPDPPWRPRRRQGNGAGPLSAGVAASSNGRFLRLGGLSRRFFTAASSASRGPIGLFNYMAIVAHSLQRVTKMWRAIAWLSRRNRPVDRTQRQSQSSPIRPLGLVGAAETKGRSEK